MKLDILRLAITFATDQYAYQKGQATYPSVHSSLIGLTNINQIIDSGGVPSGSSDRRGSWFTAGCEL